MEGLGFKRLRQVSPKNASYAAPSESHTKGNHVEQEASQSPQGTRLPSPVNSDLKGWPRDQALTEFTGEGLGVRDNRFPLIPSNCLVADRDLVS